VSKQQQRPAGAVREANRQLYDAVGGRYEELDGRRAPRLEAWLRRRLEALRKRAPGGALLDLGTGGGLVTRAAAGVFERRVGLDLSQRLLADSRGAFDLAVAGEVDRLPFADASFDAATCMAVLHHLHGFEGLVAEVRRVLRPGGIFYADHDMDAAFYRRFRLFLWIYRALRDPLRRYRRAEPQVTRRLFDLAEWHKRGVDAGRVSALLAEAGFDVDCSFHWYGLSPVTDWLFGTRPRGRGWAPLLSIVAVKPPGC
jgi:SAM-dependent methyltransferase